MPSAPSTSTSEVLRYAALGYPVIPCRARAKQPATPNGLKDASLDTTVIERWQLENPVANWATVPAGDVLVIDADTPEATDQLERTYPELMSAPKCRTPRGGAHFYLRLPDGAKPPKARPGALPDVDIRGLGKAYLLAPPSRVNNGSYTWERPLTPPAELPLASPDLLVALTPKDKGKPNTPPRTITTTRPNADHARRYAEGGLKGEIDKLAKTPKGKRNDTLNCAAFALGQFVGAGALERGEVEEALLEAALTCGLPEDEARRTMKSGLDKGELEPRGIPEPAPPQPNTAEGGHKTTMRPKRRTAMLKRLSDVEPEEISWLWHPYVPLGKLTLLEGDPGLGKTWLALTLAAIVTRGDPFPGEDGVPRGSRPPGTVLYLSAEDGIADTLRPRLDAVGADVTRVLALTGWQATDDDGQPIEGRVTLADKDVLEQALIDHTPALVIVDPLQAYLGASVDMHRANETRPLLSLLSQLAERYRCAVLAIRHLSKAPQGRAVYRGLGSIDFAAAARSILLVGEHPQNDRARVVAHVKSSLAEAGGSIGFEIVDGQFCWTGAADVTADQLLAPKQTDEERSARDEAVEFLEDILAGGPQPTSEIKKAASGAGIAWRTIERAKSGLGITSYRQSEGNSGRGQWCWELRQRGGDALTPPTHTGGGVAKRKENNVTDTHSQDRQEKSMAELQENSPTRGKSATPQDRQVSVRAPHTETKPWDEV